jgi:predicted ATPase
LRLDPGQLAAPSYSDQATPKVEPSGKGLASVLADMALSQPEEFQQIQDTLKKIVRGVVRVRIGRAQIPGLNLWGHEVILDTTAAKNIPGYLTSEGTLLVLGLLTALYQKERPKVFLLDDIDRGLHPRALESLVTAIREILKLNPELQVIATSHSPYLLDYFDAKEIRMTTTKEDGSVVCAPMTSHPDFDKWKELMKPGEFWSHVGEDWVKAFRAGVNV